MQITIRWLHKNEKVEVLKLPKSIFLHKGKIVLTLESVEEGDWLLELPETNCSWCTI